MGYREKLIKLGYSKNNISYIQVINFRYDS